MRLKSSTVGLKGGEVLSALVLLFIAAAGWWLSAGFVSRSGLVQTLSPALFPRLVLAGLAVGALALLVRAAALRNRPQDVSWGNLGRVLVAVAVMLSQAIVFDEFGTIPSAWTGLFFLLIVAQVDWRKAILVATGFLVFLYLFFIVLLRVPLPMDLFPTLFPTL